MPSTDLKWDPRWKNQSVLKLNIILVENIWTLGLTGYVSEKQKGICEILQDSNKYRPKEAQSNYQNSLPIQKQQQLTSGPL